MNKFEKYLLTIIFIELFAGGGGRWFEIGPLSLRQILFAVLLLTFFVRFLLDKKTRDKFSSFFQPVNTSAVVTILLILYILFSGFLGIKNGNNSSEAIRDVLRVSYIGAIFPLWYYIDEDRFSIQYLIKIFMYSVLFISILTLFIDFSGKYFFANQFTSFYQVINDILPGELFFRPNRGVFYKSHFIVLFGLIVASNRIMKRQQTTLDYFVFGVSAFSIILSETRGLFLGYLFGMLFILLTDTVISFITKDRTFRKKNIINPRVCLFYLLTFIFVPYLMTSSTQSRFQAGPANVKPEKVQDVSQQERKSLFSYSVEMIKQSTQTIILGNGYGSQIGDRTDGIEVTFLDIWVEQGILGVVLWLLFSLLPLYYYFRSFLQSKTLSLNQESLLSCVLVMILITNINPFLNSPIGLGFLLPIIIDSRKTFSRSLESSKQRT